MSKHLADHLELDALFDLARQTAQTPVSPAFLARLEADMAQNMVGEKASGFAPSTAVERAGLRANHAYLRRLADLWARFSAGLGGAGIVAGLTAVTASALFLGYVDPAGATEAWFEAGGLGADDAGLEIVPAAELFMAQYDDVVGGGL